MTANRSGADDSSETEAPPSRGADRRPGGDDRPSLTSVIRAISHAERRRFDHRHTSTRRKKAVVYVLTALLLPIFGALLWGAYRLGETVASGEMEGLLHLARWYLPVVIALYVFHGANEAGKRLLGFEARDLLLTTVPDRDVVLGLVLAELRESSWHLFGPTAALLVVFALGVGSPLLAVVATTAALLVTAASILVGYAVGLATRLVVRRRGLSSRLQSVLGGLGSVAVFLAFVAAGAVAGQAGASIDFGEASPADLAPSAAPPIPLGYYADFFVVGTPIGDGIGPVALASGAVVVAAIPVSMWAIVALAPKLWRLDAPTDPDDADPSSATDGEPTGRETRRDWPWLAVPSGFVADGIVRRSIRTPQRLFHVVYYAVAAGYVIVSLGVVDPALLVSALGGALALLGVWLAGGAVGLNPLGEEGSMLGQLVLSDLEPKSFVRARVLVGTAIGLPLVLAGTALLTVRTLTLGEGVLVGALLVVMVPASTGVAVGIGTLLPKSEPGRVLETFDARPPETLAILVHGVLVTVLAVAGSWLLVTDLEPALRWGTVAAVALCTVIAADGGYRFAVSGLADYGRPHRADPVYALELGTGLALLGLALSLSLETAALTQLPLSGTTAFVAAFVAGFVGWALAGIAYLFATDRSRSYLDLAVPSRRDGRYLAIGLAASLALYAGLVSAVAVFDVPVVSHPIADDLADGGWAFVGLLFALVLLVNAPVEEFLFRNVVQKRLSEAMSARRAILATSVVFGAVHVPVYAASDLAAVTVTVVPLVLVSVIWGWIYSRTRNLLVPALCHGLYNVAVFGMAAFVTL